MVGVTGLILQPTSNLLINSVNWVYVPGEGVRGTCGVESGVVVVEMTMIGMHLLGGVGDLLSRMMGEIDSGMFSLFSPRKLLI